MLQAEAEERAATEEAAVAAEQVSSATDESSSEGSVEEQHTSDLKVPTASDTCLYVESDGTVEKCFVLYDGSSAVTCQPPQSDSFLRVSADDNFTGMLGGSSCGVDPLVKEMPALASVGAG